MRVGLVADVPHKAVTRGVEHPVERDRQLNDTQSGTQVAAGYGDGIDRFQSQLVGELAEVTFGQAPQIFRRVYGV
jgi:hypothetical protein